MEGGAEGERRMEGGAEGQRREGKCVGEREEEEVVGEGGEENHQPCLVQVADGTIAWGSEVFSYT